MGLVGINWIMGKIQDLKTLDSGILVNWIMGQLVNRTFKWGRNSQFPRRTPWFTSGCNPQCLSDTSQLWGMEDFQRILGFKLGPEKFNSGETTSEPSEKPNFPNFRSAE